MGREFFQHGYQLERILVAGFGFFAVALYGFFHGGQVSQCQFGHDGLNIGQWVYLARHMYYVRIIETAHHVDDSIGLTDIGEKLVAQPLPLGCACH